MKGKKIVCFILCMVLAFTLLSGPWRAEAEAAAIAIPLTVLGIVGLFVVSSGYTFSNVGDFRSAVTDFCNKNFNMANGAAFMNVLSAIPNTSGAVELAAALQSEFFPEFWQAIKDFFGGGEVEVEVEGMDPPPDGYYYYGNNSFPIIPQTSGYTGVETAIIYIKDGVYEVMRMYESEDYFYISGGNIVGGTFQIFTLNGSTWKIKGTYSSATLSTRTLLWANRDVYSSSALTDVYFSGSEPITEGTSTSEVISVYVDETYNPAAVYNGWMSRVEAEPWMVYDASSAVFQDITTAETDKTAPMTATQTGVLSQGGVKVETETDVVIPEYTGEYAVNGLTSIFPFCIPFDIYDFFSVLVAEREAPHFEFNIDFGKYGVVPVDIDLTEWESVAKVLRTLELLGFIVGLAWATSKLIKW